MDMGVKRSRQNQFSFEIDDLCAVSLKLKRLTVISTIQNFIISHSQGLYKSK